jgi:hypothetical protein
MREGWGLGEEANNPNRKNYMLRIIYKTLGKK